ncbi:MAG: hypothetical protein MJE77_47245 [Proteobacteria bacterium]|nr:hypothetical protein [Pseudomonadota bacterium]
MDLADLLDKFGSIVLVVIFLIWPLIKRLLNRSSQPEEPQAAAEPDWDDLDWDEEDDRQDRQESKGAGREDGEEDAGEVSGWPGARGTDQPLGSSVGRVHAGGSDQAFDDPYAEERAELIERFDELIAEADEVHRTAQVARETEGIARVLDQFVILNARDSRDEIGADTGPIAFHYRAQLSELQVVFGAIEVFIRQRQIPGTRRALGDADAFAAACYQPVLDFAQVNLPEMTSAQPVAVLTPFDLSIWTGFIPTGLAPLFLPRDFFANLRWWPALAHEIGHDFLAATGQAEDLVRDELGLPDESTGQRPLEFAAGGLHPAELFRVFGAWFEEVFCDVFGTMMLGPAYGYTMIELFAEPDSPDRTVKVAIDFTGLRYDVHPPRTLRVLSCCRLLELMGEDEAAGEIAAEWNELHGEPDAILFPISGGTLGIPLDAMIEILGKAVIERLYSDQLGGFDGHSLSDIPGLAYGPHRAAEARRACDEILAGRVPSGQDARAVVAGAVLAWRQARPRHDEFLALARRAIVGVAETREDVYSRIEASPSPGDQPGTDLREAFLLHTLLSPPPSLARLRPGQRGARGFLARRTWPR